MLKDFDILYENALNAYNNAYAVYSNFKVGAAILLKNNEIISGANIENASFGLCNCAERSTLFTAYSKGYRKDDIVKMLVIANTKRPVSPCGACRQVMTELLNLDCPIILTNLNKDYKVFTVSELMPYNFNSEDMNE